MAYATLLSGDPYATYRQIDVVGRTAEAQGPGLVQLLYEELVSALRAAAWAVEHNQLRTKSDRITRATAILFALESGLDFERGGEVSNTLARLYGGIRRSIVDASIGTDPRPFREAAGSLSEIAEAWRTARAA
ncbi:flagellar protein FliS [Sphingomonas insulae]|uniref:Flagellar secretion chaperone FliS n=1 Tax=Sphingomonas insulae TaxID=424800 RepID=A0ABP3SQM0_9SPHN|nr:flagellar export chaperone FliS [Sphingomonas insulae]NIJ30069.1 flagellar protein FliS [Sphingomonas insulae]